MMNLGYVKLRREVLGNPILLKDGDHLAVYTFLVLHATHKKIQKFFNNEIIDLKPGQLITGRKYIATNLKISESKVQRILTLFETCHEIEQQTNSRNRLITISHWETENKNEQQMNNKRTTNEHIQECKNVRNKYTVFLNFLNKQTNKSFRGDKKSFRQFNARIKEKYSVDDFKKAVTNCSKSPFHKENPQYLTPEFITRVDKLEKYLNQNPKSEPHKKVGKSDAEIALERVKNIKPISRSSVKKYLNSWRKKNENKKQKK